METTTDLALTPTDWLDQTEEPWERMPVEPPQSWEGFLIYRELENRNFSEVARRLDLTPATIGKYAAHYHWKHRADRWDYHLDRLYRREIYIRTRDMAARHAQIADEALQALTRPLLNLISRDPDEVNASLDEQSVADLYKLINQTTRIIPKIMEAERTALGAPLKLDDQPKPATNITINYQEPERLGEILRALDETDLLAHLSREGDAGEIVDAEIDEIYPDPPPPETDSVPVSPPT